MMTLHDDFEDALLDLIYDELPKERAAQLRAHAAGCAKCGASLAKLTSARTLAKSLPLEEPRPEVTAAILARAREAMGKKVEQARADAPAPRARVEGERSFWAALAARLGSLLVGPQAAMAVVTVLMVGIGLYYFPRLRSHHAVEGGRTVDPDPTGEAGPSAEISPAAPLDLRYDPRTRRIVDAHDAPPPSPPSRATPPATGNTDGDEATTLAQMDEHVDTPLPTGPTAATGPIAPVAADDTFGDARSAAAHGHAGGEAQAGRVMQDPLAGGDSIDGVAQLEVAPGATLGVGVAGGARSAGGAGVDRGLRDESGAGTVSDLERARTQRADGFREQVAQLAPAENDAPRAPPMDLAPNRQAPMPTAHHASPAPMARLAAPSTPTPTPSGGYYAGAPSPVVAPPPSAPPAQAQGMAPMPVAPERRMADNGESNLQNLVPRATATGSTNGSGATVTVGTGMGPSGGGAGGGYGRAPVPDSTDSVTAHPPTNEPVAPLALHHRARSEAATSPQLAIRDYESLLARYPTYPESGAAMLELAELYRRTGEVGRARSLVTRAEAVPATRDDARRMRVRLDQMDRAATSVEAASSH